VVRTIRQHGAAPGDLELVRSFINTARLEGGVELLREPDDLAAWLRGHGLLAAGVVVADDDLEVAIAVRESLRDLAGVHGGHEMPPASSAKLDAVVSACGLRPRFEAGGALSLAPELDGVAGALGRMLGIVVASAGHDDWARMKTCRNPHCRWAFYDSTRNRSAVWCDMASCGNRAKARRYYEKQRLGSGTAGA